MSFLFAPPFMTILDDDGNPLSGGQLKFYLSGTLTKTQVYADADLAVSLGATVTADASGRCAPIYLDEAVTYRCRTLNAAGAVIKDVDPISPTTSITGEVRASDFYDSSDGDNYLPAFRAAYAYAKTNGIKKMRSGLPWGNIEWWAPTLSMANSDVPFDVDGPTNFLTISHDIDIDFEHCTINCKAYNGGSIQTTTQAITGNAAWRGHGINVIGGTNGTSSFGIKGVSIRNLILDGGCDRVTGANAGAELASSDYLSHKGFRIQDTGVENLYFENVTIKRFRGELWYLAQLANTAKVTLVNCNGYTSNQSALNPSSGNLTVIGGNFGDAPICVESLGGVGQQYIGTRFYNSWQGSFLGAANFTPAATPVYAYTVPLNTGYEAELPWVDFRGVVFDNGGLIAFANYIRGNIKAQDTALNLSYTNLTNKMIDLDIAVLIHKRAYTSLITMEGPPTLTTAISGSYPAVYCQPLEDIKLRVNVSRTAYALANAVGMSSVLDTKGYIKQESCQIIIESNSDALDGSSNLRIGTIAQTTGTQKSLPRIFVESSFGSGSFITWNATNKAISPTGPAAQLVQQGAAGTYDITFTNAMDTANGYNYAHGQRLRCVYNGFTTAGTVMRFPASGWGLPRDIKLRAREDWIEFSFNKFTGKWIYEAHSTTTDYATTTDQLTGTSVAEYSTPDSVAALWEQGADVASAGTISLGEGGYFNVTGTTTITDIDFATDKAGRKAWLKFAGALTLTHSGTTLILPGAANITTAAGDTACFISEGSDVVRCVAYSRATGQSVISQSTDDFTPETWSMRTNGATATTYGTTAVTASLSAGALANTNYLTKAKRIYTASSAAANSSCYCTSGADGFYGEAGGRFKVRYGMERSVSDTRLLIGLGGTSGLTADPSARTNVLGVGKDAADSNLQIMHNDGSGTCTKIDLGANFPANTDGTAYDVEFNCAAGMTSATYTVTRLDTAFTATGTITTNLPAASTTGAIGVNAGTGPAVPGAGLRVAFMAAWAKSNL